MAIAGNVPGNYTVDVTLDTFVVEVKTYGVLTTNTAAQNDTAISTMLTAVPSGSLILFSEPGIYLHSQTILPPNGKLLEFCGFGGFGNETPNQGSENLTVLQWTGGASPQLQTQPASDGTRICNLTFENNGSATAAIWIDGTYHAYLDHVSIEGDITPYSTAGLVISGANTIPALFVADKCSLKGNNTTPGTSVGILIHVGCDVARFNDCNVAYHQQNLVVDTTCSTLVWDGGNNEMLAASGNSGRGVYVAGGQNIHLIHTHYETVDTGQRAIEIAAMSGGSIKGNFFNGGSGPSDYAILSSGAASSDVIVEDNVFTNVGIAGIDLHASTNWNIGKNSLGTGATAILPNSNEGSMVLVTGANNDNMVIPQFPMVTVSGLTGDTLLSGLGGVTNPLAGPANPGQLIIIYNQFNHNLTLVHEAPTSINVNRINTTSGSNVVLTVNTLAGLMWIPATQRWRILFVDSIAT